MLSSAVKINIGSHFWSVLNSDFLLISRLLCGCSHDNLNVIPIRLQYELLMALKWLAGTEEDMMSHQDTEIWGALLTHSQSIIVLSLFTFNIAMTSSSGADLWHQSHFNRVKVGWNWTRPFKWGCFENLWFRTTYESGLGLIWKKKLLWHLD